MDITTITTALTGIKTTFDLVAGAAHTLDELQLARAEKLFSEEIVKVNLACLDLIAKCTDALRDKQVAEQRTRELEAMLAELRKWYADRSRYQLQELAPGNFAYAYVPVGDDTTPAHWICQPCMDGLAKKYVLRKQTSQWAGTHLCCPSCMHEVETDGTTAGS